MRPSLNSVVQWIQRRAENVVSILLGIMFVAFVIQIVFRYFFNLPVGWSSELSVIIWLYMVLLGSAFWLRTDEELRFDLITGSVSPGVERGLVVVSSVATVILFAMAMPATLKYVTFMKVESTSYLKIRFDVLYSVYILFAAGLIVRYAWAAWQALRGDTSAQINGKGGSQ